VDNIYALNIERAVLSSIFFNPEEIEDVLGILKPNDFYLPAHKKIFEAMEILNSKDLPIDEEFIRKQVDSKEVDDSIIVEILSANAITNTLAYAKEIKDASVKRELIALATDIKKVTIEDELPATEAVDFVQNSLYKITTDSASSELKNMAQITQDTLLHIQEMKKRGNAYLIGETTGFDSLDRKTTGFNNGDLVIIAARPAMGKCLGKGTKVVMFDGTLKNVEDIQVGDKLMGDDSTARTVLSLARGREKMYWVRQNKGIDYRVNESHILSLKRSRNEGKHKHGDVLNISIKDYINKSQKFHSNYKGYKVAIDFHEQVVPIEPYFMGVWLGDGTSANVGITSQDDEVINYLKSYAKRLKLKLKKQTQKNKTPIYCITTRQQGGSIVDDISLQKKLREIGVLNNKHIPHSYLQNSEKNRLELLAGLIDSDGYYDKKFNVFEIVQKDEKLAKQIKFLADSLGFRVSFKVKKAKIKKINYECDVYRIRIVGELDRIPTKIKRKQARKLKAKREVKHTGIKVEYDKVDDYYGFVIDGNHLFLLEDMTVTHNTSFVLNTTLQNVERGAGVIFFSLEMPAEQLMIRLISAKTRIPLQNVRKGDLDDKQWSTVTQAFEDLNQKKLFVDDGGSVNINQLRARVRKIAGNPENNIKMIVIDYLQLMQGTGGKDRHLEVSEISRGLKMLAREMEVPILALSQLNRGLESRPDKRPMLSDIRESGSIEQDADIIMFVYRDDVYKERDEQRKEKEAKDRGETYKSAFINKPIEEAEIIIGKQRNGPVGTVKLDFHKELTRFVDKDNPHGAAPTITTFESVADAEKETQIDIPEQFEQPIHMEEDTKIDMPDIDF
jgi:replicative DNA helicase